MKRKDQIIQDLSKVLVTETDNTARAVKALNDANASHTAMREAYAEMEGERDLYRIALSIAIGRLSAYTPTGDSSSLMEFIIAEAVGEITSQNKR